MKKWFRIPVLLMVVLAVIIAVQMACDPSKKSPSVCKIALVQYNDSPLSELSQQGILEGLALAGLKNEKDFEMKVYNAQGDIGTMNLIFDAVINYRPRLVFVTSTPTLQMAIKKVKDIPLVFSAVADPVLAGAGNSFSDHLPNVTGISTMGDYQGMAAIIHQILPQTKRIGTLYSPGELNSVRNMEELKKYAAQEGIELLTTPVNSTSETADAISSLLARQPEIVCQVIDNLTAASIASVIKASKNRNIPVFGFINDQVEKGAVLVISRDYVQAGKDAARLAKQILDGTDPASLPFEFVSRTNLLINKEAAAQYGILIPEEVYRRDNVIQTGDANSSVFH
jgi:ABC-type uncharacterized transport system substrate-binding protein